MQVLVTAFEPFGGDPVNASLEALRRLPRRAGRYALVTAVLPVSYARSLSVLDALLEQAQPDLVLCTGQAAGRARLCVERIAVNRQDASIADNDGLRPIDVPVVPGGPAAYLASLPAGAGVRALRAAGLPAEISMNAGTFVCNHVFYGLMHRLSAARSRVRAGFLHVPALPGRGGPDRGPDAEALARGICALIEAVGR